METEVDSKLSKWFYRVKVVVVTTVIVLVVAGAVWLSLSYAPYTVGS